MKPRSMEEKISYLLFLMGFAGLLCTAALCILCSTRLSGRRRGQPSSGRPISWLPGAHRWMTPAS